MSSNNIKMAISISALIGLIITAGLSNTLSAKSFDDTEKTAIQSIIKDYLLKNPEVIRDAIEELERRNAVAEKQRRQKLIAENKDLLHDPKSSFITGNPKGDVTVIEYFDYNCPYCRQSLIDVVKLIENDKNVRVILKEYPILGEASKHASLVAIAARKQNKYMEIHTALLSAKGRLDNNSIMKIAEGIGLDMEKLKADMASDETKTILNKNIESGLKVGINGTPSFIINDELIPQVLPYEAMKGFISRLRKAS